MTIQYIASEQDKTYQAAQSGLLQRILGPREYWDDSTKQAVGDISRDNSFVGARLPRIARELLTRAGHPQARTAADHEVVRMALQRSSAYHTTGSFTNLMSDTMQKTLRASYDDAQTTYQRWVRIGEPARSYRELNRIVFGDLGIPSEVPEGHEYPEGTTTDAKESYRVHKHGQLFSVSLESAVNDDLDAFTAVPRKQGNAMRRKINRDVYSILADNAALADGVALFHASSHGANLDATALSEDALDVGHGVMATQAGTDSTTILGIQPRWLIVPQGLAATALRLVNGNQLYPATQDAVPLYGPNGPRSLEVIADGQLDSLVSATAWWLAADARYIDTVEVTFLQGEEQPVLEQHEGFHNDTMTFKIRQSYGVKAIDYRGLYQGNS